jgi:hypothetical protein
MLMTARRLVPALALVLATAFVLRAQAPDGAASPYKSDLELVEHLLVVRRDYQVILEQLRAHYLAVGDVERAKWAEEELIHFHRIPKHAFRLELDVPPPTLHGSTNVPAANKLYTRALGFKDKGWGTDYVDNQRRAELLFQQILTQYPQSDRISDTAYMLGDIYESKAYKQYRRAGAYFERCFQWNPSTHFDARLRAARLYDRQLLDRAKATEIYKEITTHETDPKRLQEAQSRLTELSGNTAAQR